MIPHDQKAHWVTMPQLRKELLVRGNLYSFLHSPVGKAVWTPIYKNRFGYVLDAMSKKYSEDHFKFMVARDEEGDLLIIEVTELN